MGFFTSKKEVKLEDFCADFYNKNILDGVIQGIDINKTYYEEFKKNISELFPEFLGIDFNKLKEEFTVIRFELFALAWQHTFDKIRNGDISVEQSIFTLNFLMNKNNQNIWDKMQPYNKTLADSVKIAHGSTSMGQMGNQMLDMNRLNFFEEQTKKAITKGINTEEDKKYSEAIARVANRLDSKSEWNSGIGANYLSFVFLRNLGFTDDKIKSILSNKEMLSRLANIMKGFYKGSKEALEDIKIIN